VLAPLYLGKGKSHTKYASMLKKDIFIRNMKKEWLKNKRTKIDNILFNTFGPLVSFECLWST
jgi:hypothetical protein